MSHNKGSQHPFFLVNGNQVYTFAISQWKYVKEATSKWEFQMMTVEENDTVLFESQNNQQ